MPRNLLLFRYLEGRLVSQVSLQGQSKGFRRPFTSKKSLRNASSRRAPMRLAGRERLGFYPLPIPEAGRIRRFLRFPDQQCSALDPCIGDGVALAKITCDAKVLRYGIELDANRAGQARSVVDDVIHGNC